jgi:hypothetical protein
MLRSRLAFSTIRPIAVLGILLAVPCCSRDGLDGKTYRDPKGQYSVAYPGTWYQEPDAAGFRIYNFPPSRFRPQLILPDGGALIAFALRYPPAQTLDAWIEHNVKLRGADFRRTFRMRLEHQASDVDVTETVSHWASGNIVLEDVDWYFSIQGIPFDAALMYYKGDPDADGYRKVLQEVVSSITILSPKEKR